MEITTTANRRSGRFVRLLVNSVCLVTILLAGSMLVPAAFGLQRYVITGSSMGGSLGVGTVVFEEVVPISDLRVGDVITYMPPPESGIDHLITHRIVAIKGDKYRTKGDANADADPWTFELSAASQPRMSHSVPYVGLAFIALQDRVLRVLLIGIPAGAVALISLVQLVGALRRRPRSATSPVPAPKPAVPVG